MQETRQGIDNAKTEAKVFRFIVSGRREAKVLGFTTSGRREMMRKLKISF